MGRARTKTIDGYKVVINNDFDDYTDRALLATFRLAESRRATAMSLDDDYGSMIQAEEDMRHIRREMQRRGMPRPPSFL